jgi:hypothetical protein
VETKGDHNTVKLLLTYDPRPEQREEYFRFVMGEFVPALEQLGLTMCEAWHTAYGDYPLRLTGFLAEDMDAMQGVLASDAFRKLEVRLLTFVENYRRRVVHAGQRFQF